VSNDTTVKQPHGAPVAPTLYPIATALRDGTVIVGYWDNGPRAMDVQYKHGCWMRGDTEFREPTHWHPIGRLPEPPKPVWRPWKAEEVPLLAWVRYKTQRDAPCSLILARGKELVGCTYKDWTFKDIFDQCEHSVDGGKTWNPCGVQEVSK